MPQTGSTPITTCTGTIYDNGGPAASYSSNCDGVITIYPSGMGNYVKLTFTSFSVENCGGCDRLMIYNGTSTTSPVIGSYTSSPGTIYSTDSSGALTLRFITDMSVESSGFSATIECVTSIPTADLTVVSPSVNPTNAFASGTVSASCTVSNIGAYQSSSSQLGYFLSTDTTYDSGSDIFLSSSSVSTLNPGATTTASATLTIPAGTSIGSYYILFFADYQNNLLENSETNNVKYVVITVSTPNIDLLINNPNVTPASPPAGTSVTVSCTIQNNGSISASSSQVGYYLSTDSVYDAGVDVYLNYSSGGSLSAGGTSSRSGTVTIPSTTALGSYYILFFADYQNNVAELNETNNVRAVPITVVQTLIDLTITTPTLSLSTVTAGLTVSATCYISNTGNTDASSSNVGYYLSTDNVWDVNDVYLTYSNGSSLYPGSPSYRTATLIIPGATAAGSYYIIFFADYQYAVTETNENNNTAIMAITVIPSVIDLVITSPSASPTITTNGGSISLSSMISNNGSTQSPSSTVGYYLSTDTVWGPNDTYLIYSNGSSLNGGSSSSRTANVIIPFPTPPGNYYILFYADYQNTVDETNENNNVEYVGITVTLATIDLAITSPSVSPLSVLAGSSVSVSCMIHNYGNATASSSQVGYYLSTDTVYDASDTYLNYSSGSSLAGGASLSKSRTVTIPTSIASGTYYILFYADYYNYVAETVETNNMRSVAISVVAAIVDLVPSSPFVSPQTVTAGSSVSTSCTITNLGNTNSSFSYIGVYLSTDAIYDASDTYVYSEYVSSLSGGSSSTEIFFVTIPSATPSGTYYLLFYADYSNYTVESNELNNVVSSTIIVTAANIDLVVQNQTLSPISVAAGGTVAASCSVVNLGNSTASSSSLGYFLSTDTVWDASDSYLTNDAVGFLSSGNSESESATLTIPSATPLGTYYILFFADYANSVLEVNETNNVWFVAITVVLPTVDLIITSPSVSPASIPAGSNMSVSCSIHNQGSSSASSSTVGYYLSADNVWDASDIYLNYSSGSNLSAGSFSSRSSTLTIPFSVVTGSYYILFYADYNGAVSESVETNNVSSVAITVMVSVIDLVITNPAISPSSIVAGTSMTATCYVQNNGNTSASASSVCYYLSSDNVWDVADVYLNYSSGSSLSAGASSFRSITVTIPSSTPTGTYYLLFFADCSNAVTESVETNNVNSVSVNIINCNSIAVSVSLDTTSGCLNAVVTGGTPPYLYVWSPGGMTSNPICGINPLSNYSLTVTDNIGCNAVDDYVGCPVTASITSTGLLCYGQSATLTASGSGGNAPYLYQWSNGANSASITAAPLVTTTYTVTVTDSTNCSDSAFEIVYVPQAVVASISQSIDSVNCPGGTILTLTATGGTPAYTYSWSTGETTPTICAILPATYCLTVMDANACTATSCSTVGCNLSVSISGGPCAGPLPSLQGNASSGTPPYTYSWSSGDTSQVICNLTPGTYCLTVIDGLGCTATSCQTVGGCIVTAFIFVDQNGSLIASAPGGTPPISFLWSDGSTASVITNPTGGTYCVTVTDSNGCTATACDPPCSLSVTVNLDSSGCLISSVTGGTPPYSYQWSNGSIGDSICNVNTLLNYTLVVTDSNGCSGTATYSGNCQITLIFDSLIVVCPGIGYGISIIPVGGTPPYTYSWSNGATTSWTCIPAPGGTYSLTVADANGCTTTATYTAPHTGCAFSHAPVFVTTPGLSPYTILFTASYDSLLNPANILWDFGDGDTASGLAFIHDFDTCNTSYNVTMTLTDSLGNMLCVSSQPVFVSCFPFACQARFIFSQDSSNNLTYHFTDQSVYNPVAYQWNFGDNTSSTLQNPSHTYPLPGIYTVCLVVTDSTGCSNTACVQVTVSNLPVQDLRANLFHFTTVTPGFPLWVRLTYCNDGTIAMNGTVQYRYPAGVTFTYSTPSSILHDIAQRLLTFSFSNLLPGACRTIAVDLLVGNALPLGSLANDTMWVFPVTGDATPPNNVSVVSDSVVGSWDPNDKANSPKGSGKDGEIPVNTEHLTYQIRFQNTGTAPAHNVEIRDVIDNNIDLSSIKVSEASHNHTAQVIGNELVVTFNNIMLPDSNSNETASHGYTVVNATLKPGLTPGTQIFNTAEIYFDFNPPVITNTVVNTLKDASTGIGSIGLEFGIAPNPAQDLILLTGKFSRNSTFEIINNLGQTALNGDINSDKTPISIEKLNQGIYFVKVKSRDKTGVERLVITR